MVLPVVDELISAESLPGSILAVARKSRGIACSWVKGSRGTGCRQGAVHQEKGGIRKALQTVNSGFNDWCKRFKNAQCDVAVVFLSIDGIALPIHQLNFPRDQDLQHTIFVESGLTAVGDRGLALQEESPPRCLAYPRFKVNVESSTIALY